VDTGGAAVQAHAPMNSWFWRPGFEIQSADKIAGEYADCRKRNSNLLLNLSPDTSGPTAPKKP